MKMIILVVVLDIIATVAEIRLVRLMARDLRAWWRTRCRLRETVGSK